MTNAPVIDRETIDMLREMDAITKEDELLLELIDDFLFYSTDLVSAMKRASPLQVSDELAAQSHSLKGASLNIGALALFSVCDAIETLARARELSTLVHWLTELDHAYQKTTVALIELRNRTCRGEDINDLLG